MSLRPSHAALTTLVTLVVGASAWPGRTAAQSLVRPGEVEHLERIDRKRWQGELYLAEFQETIERCLDPARGGDRGELLHAEFRGVAPSRVKPSLAADDGGLRLERRRFESRRPAGGADFVSALRRYFDGFDRIDRFELHVSRADVRPETEPPVVDVEVDTLLVGATCDRRRSDRATWRAVVTRTAEDRWVLYSLAALELETARGVSAFTDATGSLPDSFRQTHPKTNRYTDFPANNGVTLADWDGDGDLDLYVFRPYLPGLFYENDGLGRFHDRRPEGIEEPEDLTRSLSGAGYFFDHDNDGDLDFLLLRNSHPIALFRNDDGQFRAVGRASGFSRLPRRDWIGAAISDYDRDGDLDLYLLRYADRDPQRSYFDSPGNSNHLLQNDGSGRFVDATAASGMTAGNRRISWAAAWGDYNDDGWPDLYVANDFGPNKLYTNRGDGTFSEDAERLGIEDRANGMGASWSDYDNDGRLDLYVSNMHSYAGERITRQLDAGLEPGRQSLPRRFSRGNALFRGLPDGEFAEVTPEVEVAKAGWAWGHVFLDYDNDGDQDLYVVNGYFSNLIPTDT